jgi:hypothetical protein
MKPTIGRTVIFRITEEQAQQINRRRTNSQSIAARIGDDKWPLGAQAHIGNEVHAGDEFPMVIVRVWNEWSVNGQAMLDGNDTLWTLSAQTGNENGQWRWPERVEGIEKL